MALPSLSTGVYGFPLDEAGRGGNPSTQSNGETLSALTQVTLLA